MSLPRTRLQKVITSSHNWVSSQFESLDFDVWKNELEIEEEKSLNFGDVIFTNLIRWFLYLLVGFVIGLITAIMDFSFHHLHLLRDYCISPYVNMPCDSFSCYGIWILAWCSRTLVPVIITAIMIIFVPSAAGSGIPRLKAYLNGVHILDIDSFKVLIVKIVGSILICSSGLATGKEGPIIHIGAITASLVLDAFTRIQFPQIRWKCLLVGKSVIERRDIMTAGYAAGFAVSFGSATGTLLSLEEGTSFYSLQLMWKVYFCSAMTIWSYSFFIVLLGPHFNVLNFKLHDRGDPDYFNFGDFKRQSFDVLNVEWPFLISIGVIGGLLGALFIHLSSHLDRFRMNYVRGKFLQFVETLMVAILTAAISGFSVLVLNNCISAEPVVKHSASSNARVNLNCVNNTVNQMLYFWYRDEECVVGKIFNESLKAQTSKYFLIMLFFALTFFVLFVITAGLKVPVGCFIPSITFGAAWGHLYGEIVLHYFPLMKSKSHSLKYSVLGAAAQLGGTMRITMSIALIIMHATVTTDNSKFHILIVLICYISKWVGDLFTEDFYETILRNGGYPVLSHKPPVLTNYITAQDLMNRDVIAFPLKVKVSQVVHVFETSIHQGFPVVDEYDDESEMEDNPTTNEPKTFGELKGSVLRSDLLIVLYTKSFCSSTDPEICDKITLEKLRQHRNLKLKIDEIKLTDEEKTFIVDLSPIINFAPYTVPMIMPYPRIFNLVKYLGLRHLIVVNNKNQVVGIITRRSLARIKVRKSAISMELLQLNES